jgi:hypothetical protein
MARAIEINPKVATTLEAVGTHEGTSPAHLELLGLDRPTLRRLERLGLAIRARTKNVWLPGEGTPDGRPVLPNTTARGKGSRIKWILIQK